MRFRSLSLLAALPLLGMTLSAHATSIAGIYNLEDASVKIGQTTYTITGQVVLNSSGLVTSSTLILNDSTYAEPTDPEFSGGTNSGSAFNGLSQNYLTATNGSNQGLGQLNLFFDTTPVAGGDLDLCLNNSQCGTSMGTTDSSSVMTDSEYYMGHTITGFGNTDLNNGAYLAPASVAVSPEPSSLVLLGTGLIGAAGAMRRRFIKA